MTRYEAPSALASAFARPQKAGMRLAFMGTPDFAVPTLEALIAAGHEVAVV